MISKFDRMLLISVYGVNRSYRTPRLTVSLLRQVHVILEEDVRLPCAIVWRVQNLSFGHHVQVVAGQQCSEKLAKVQLPFAVSVWVVES